MVTEDLVKSRVLIRTFNVLKVLFGKFIIWRIFIVTPS